jgi:hypothetical protein
LAVSGTARPNAYFTVPGDGKEIVCGCGAAGTLGVVGELGRVGTGVGEVAPLEFVDALPVELADPLPDRWPVVGVDDEPLVAVVVPTVVGTLDAVVSTALDVVDPSVTTAPSDVPGAALVTSVLSPSVLSSVSPDPLHALRRVAPPIAAASSQRGVAVQRSPRQRATATSRCEPTSGTSLGRSPSASRMSVQM